MVSWKLDDALDEIDATEDQRLVFSASADRLLAAVFAQRDAHRADRAAMVEQLLSAEPDKERLHALVDARLEIARGLAHTAVDELLIGHKTLTDSQRSQLAAMVAKQQVAGGNQSGDK